MKLESNLIQFEVIEFKFAKFIFDDGQNLDAPPIAIDVLGKINACSI